MIQKSHKILSISLIQLSIVATVNASVEIVLCKKKTKKDNRSQKHLGRHSLDFPLWMVLNISSGGLTSTKKIVIYDRAPTFICRPTKLVLFTIRLSVFVIAEAKSSACPFKFHESQSHR